MNSEERSRQELLWSWAISAVSVSITKLADRRPRRAVRPEVQIIGLELQQTKTAPGPHVQIDRFHQQQPDPGYCSIVSRLTGIIVQLEHGLRQKVYLRKSITKPCWLTASLRRRKYIRERGSTERPKPRHEQIEEAW